MCGIYSLSLLLFFLLTVWVIFCLSFSMLSLCVCVFSPSDLVSPLDISVVDYGGLYEWALFLNRWLIKQHVCIGKLSIFSVLFVLRALCSHSGREDAAFRYVTLKPSSLRFCHTAGRRIAKLFRLSLQLCFRASGNAALMARLWSLPKLPHSRFCDVVFSCKQVWGWLFHRLGKVGLV